MAKVKFPKEKPIGPGFIQEPREVYRPEPKLASIRKGFVAHCGILNIRERPSITAKILFAIQTLTELTISNEYVVPDKLSGKSTLWFEVDVKVDGTIKHGFCVAQYVQEITNA